MSASPHATRADERAASLSTQARILPNSERERVEQLLARKYRIDRFTVYPIYRLVRDCVRWVAHEQPRSRSSHTEVKAGAR
jgi:hypothetical protein